MYMVKQDTIQQNLSRIFHGVYQFFWILILPGIAVVTLYFDWKGLLLLLPVVLLLYRYRVHCKTFFLRHFTRISDFIDHTPHSAAVMILILMGVQFLLQLYLGMELAVTPSGDRHIIYEQAVEIANSGNWHTSGRYNFYFLRYPNNQFLLILESLWFVFLKHLKITNYLYGNIVLNLLCIDAAILSGTFLVCRKYKKKAAVLFQVMALLFPPFYSYLPFVYTDTLALPVVMGILVCYEYVEEFWESKGIRFYSAIIGIGILTWIGYVLKPTIAILFIACALHMMIARQFRRGLACTILIVLIFSLCTGAYYKTISRLAIVDQTDYETENFPYSHWIMMGLKGIGIYNVEDRRYTSSFVTKEEKQQANIAMIETRLHSYGIPGLLIHQYAKGVTTWHSGRYDMEFYLAEKPLKSSWLQKFFYKDQSCYFLYSLHCTIFQLFLLSALTISIVQGYKKRSLDSAVVWKLALFGLYLFLSIWETRPRYVMHFIPVLFLIAIDTIMKNKSKIRQRPLSA